MANLIDPGGCGEYLTDGYSLSGQIPVYGGGGMRRQLVPLGGENEVLESVQHYAIVPIFLARFDNVTMEHDLTNESIGAPNQPVTGGQPSPTGLVPADQFDPTRLDSGDWNAPLRYVRSPRQTTVADDPGAFGY